MNDFLTRLAKRTIAPAASIRPRPRIRFEGVRGEPWNVPEPREQFVSAQTGRDSSESESSDGAILQSPRSTTAFAEAERTGGENMLFERPEQITDSASRPTEEFRAQAELAQTTREGARPEVDQAAPRRRGSRNRGEAELAARNRPFPQPAQQRPNAGKAAALGDGSPAPRVLASLTDRRSHSERPLERVRELGIDQSEPMPGGLLRRLPPRVDRPKKPAAETPVSITIGRIDIRSGTPAPRKKHKQAAPTAPVMSLADYLKRRNDKQ